MLLLLLGVGLIVVGSCDGNCFYFGMGMLFLCMMGEVLVVVLVCFDLV